jgi:hypothetical protein
LRRTLAPRATAPRTDPDREPLLADRQKRTFSLRTRRIAIDRSLMRCITCWTYCRSWYAMRPSTKRLGRKPVRHRKHPNESSSAVSADRRARRAVKHPPRCRTRMLMRQTVLDRRRRGFLACGRSLKRPLSTGSIRKELLMNVAVSVPTDACADPHLFIGGEWVVASSAMTEHLDYPQHWRTRCVKVVMDAAMAGRDGSNCRCRNPVLRRENGSICPTRSVPECLARRSFRSPAFARSSSSRRIPSMSLN